MLALVLVALWSAPVDGPVLRPFSGGEDPFARGLRRAVVLEAAAGEVVRAPCAGRVLFAGATPRGPALTLRCAGRRATLMPVRAAVRRGQRVRRGAHVAAALGDVRLSARAHDGAYVRPPLGAAPPPAAPPPATSRLPRVRAAAPRAGPAEPPGAPAPPAVPWTAWVGVALLLGAAVRVRCVSVRARARGARRRIHRPA